MKNYSVKDLQNHSKLRWGVLVHQSEGVGAGWDGRIGGRVAAPGVYYYILNADHSCLDADLTEVGEVTLIVD